MATYEWIGPGHPLYAPKFNCFVEDWDRSKGADGHLRCRSANFIDAKILDSNGVAHVATFDSFLLSVQYIWYFNFCYIAQTIYSLLYRNIESPSPSFISRANLVVFS